VDVERVTLKLADYSIAGLSDVVAIERKSTQDLVQSITRERERFFDECRALREFEFRLLIVEASVEDIYAALYRGRTRPESVIGSTLALYADYGLPTLWSGSAKNAANMAERILTRLWRKRVEGKAA
jgi:ERCC4-type nuclease